MNITAIGLILIFTVIACSIQSSAAIGEDCTHNDNCTETGQVCDGTCVCFTANYYNQSGNKCVKELGRDCTIPTDCNDVNVICDNSNCQCKDTHYDDNGDTSLGGSCIAKHAFGDSCTNPASAPYTVQCSDANADCKAVSGGTYTCQCNNGYYRSGENCLQDGCDTNPCQHGGTCTNEGSGHTCSCVAGYTGSDCESDIDDCSSITCQHGGACQDLVNSYTCNCAAGYTGEYCQTDIDDCSSITCQHGGTCIDEVNSYRCNCAAGYTDKNCQTNINECNTITCQHGGTCIDGINRYTCNCVAGYTGNNCQTDIDDCSSITCQHGGTCIDEVNSYRCNCAAGYTGNNCQTDIDECTQGTHSCNANAACTNNVGSYTCKCRTGYTGDGFTCSDVDECSNNGDNCNANADCSNNPGSFTCTCQPGYTGNGVTCSDIDECASGPCKNGGACTNLVNAYSCSCTNGYSGKNCQVASLGASCSQSGTTCADRNARCQSNGQGGNNCLCTSSYYDSDGLNNIGGTCTPKVGLGSNCPMPNACSSSRAECVGSKCRCNDTYYDTNTDNTIGGTCETRINLGGPCSSNHLNNKQCIDQNASCRWLSSYICSCDERYHPEGSSCKPNIALGGYCQGVVDNECSDPNAECINNKCTCKVGYYRFFEGNSQSNCRTVQELQVTGITFSNIRTTEFTVSWTAPTRSSYVSGYDVEWQNGGNVVGATSPQRVTGLTPGKTYVVKVISKDTATEPDVTRTTYTSKQQAAKPSIPGPVTSTENDLDASDGNIDIKWTAGTGVITLYRVKLFDGDTQKGSRDASFVSTTFNNVLNGYRYNVSVTARSQQFNGGYLWSETKVTTIKTKVQVPEAPRNGVCKSPTDSSITLDWDEPSLPNGDLVRYHIDVMDTSYKVLFRDITTGTPTEKVVGNLQPGTNYIFRLYTENEGHNSTNYDQVSSACKTRAKMSESPTQLAVTEVTSRGFDISWEKPGNTFSEENYGYVLQIKDETSSCWKEVIYRCSDCRGSFIPSSLDDLCDPAKRNPVIDKTKQELASELTYSAVLHPDIVYTVSVTAINDAGKGHAATYTQRTNEEAPQKPYQVSVTDINSTNFTVNWKIGSPRPGNTSYTIKIMTDIAQSKEFNVVGYVIRNYMVTGLEEFWNYTVTVTASTSIGPNISDVSDTYQTLPAAPGKVHGFRKHDAPNGDYLKLKITWKAPVILERNSIIKKYKYEHNASEELVSLGALSQNEDEGYEYNVILNVVPEEYYSFEVFAVNEQDLKGEPINQVIKTKAGVPINIETELNVDVVEGPKESSQQRQFTVTFAEDFFNQTRNGAIRATGFVVCKDSKCDTKDSMNLSDFNTLDAWSVGLKKGYYRATEADWLKNLKSKTSTPNSRRKREVEVVKQEFIVGSDTCSSNTDSTEYCNGPVDPETSYIVIAVACTNGGCLISKKYGPFVTAAVPDDATNLGLIIGIVVAAVVIVVLAAVIIVLVLRRRRGRKSDGMKRTHDTDDEDVNFDPATEKIPRKRPINLNDIEEYVANMHKDSNLLFSAEYEELKTLSPKHACEAADREENRMRNRYINIIPFDHSRVKLSTNGEDDSADYINGNYLPGYNSPREYIGCQGPIPGTIDDFWRMTWEQNVSVIVMLTLCKEGQKIKCEQYWPDEVGEPKQYGDVIVEITSYSNIRTYDYRMFRITNGSTTRVVKHFHFLSWLDFQANVHHDIILDFIQHVRQHVQPPDTSGPMIIHCSAGVGRTGTYIALDHLMQFINEHDFDVEIDIFDLVLKLRENRQHMVQTEQQYVFIHDCVKEIMERKRRQMENIYENQGFSQDENIYQNEQSLYANVSISKAEQNTEL